MNEADMSSDDKQQPTAKDYQTPYNVDWCPGCGDYGILKALEQALAALNIAPDQAAVFGGIGCSGKTPYYINTYGVHTLHGRVLPFASGAKLANPALTVIAVGGDGDGLSIGAGHFVNHGRRNLDLTYILFNNGVYGLTKGQASPTLGFGEKTKNMAQNNWQEAVNPILLALTAGFTWIGRGYAYNVSELSKLVTQAISHPGLAYLDVLQPCPVYNDIYTKDWYSSIVLEAETKRLYSLQDEGYDPVIPASADTQTIQDKKAQCFAFAQQWGERIPTGIFLQDLSRTRFLDQVTNRYPFYPARPPAQQPIVDETGHSLTDLSAVFAELKVS
jgi:2-oxoglutarate ferredoxin oxidoreductase subunit beta